MASKRSLVVIAVLLSSIVSAEPLVGAGVGNADALISEASRLYNKKQHAKAVDLYLKATRVSPTTLPTYLQLARSSVLAKQIQRGCYAYRVYLKASPETPERKKASAESDQCERQLKNAKGQPPDLSQKYVETRAAFFAQLDKGLVLGPTGASEELRTLVKDGFLGIELADMAQKLGSAAVAQAEGIHKRALANEKLPSEQLRSARPLFQIAADCGVTAGNSGGVTAFLDGLAEFTEKDDPRTAVLRTALALGNSPEVGASELERLLFTTRFPAEK